MDLVIIRKLLGRMQFAQPYVLGEMLEFGRALWDIQQGAEYGGAHRQERAVATMSNDPDLTYI